MRTPDVRRWTGLSALAVAVFLGIEAITKLLMPDRPQLDDSEALIAYAQASSTQTFIVILADTFVMAFLIVFLASFRQLVNKARPDVEWLADLAFGAGLVFIAVTLVGDAMDGGAALDVIGLEPDASAIRTLIEGHAIMFGSTGAVLLALVSGTSAYLTFLSGAVPRWTGILAAVTAVSNLIWAPFGFTGTSPNSFLASGGAGNAIFAIFPWLVWVFCVGITTVRGAQHGAPRSGAPAGGPASHDHAVPKAAGSETPRH
ncbi:hypothetical protein ACFSBZ_04905 [Amnibacterium flavum]|uniref:DUF4386 domain-containing protein n=1 Tax=Amnibacterium flavum TaxID=2173173 RepID=A0A2V1HT04_9MICO|nr:hypothetical protein [Amnibacterium flavum]PVZ94179.1 hypothetical protein DDQ50_10570 [Amnibacterium flavum]